MISICIPVYNCDISKLVGNLLAQLAKNAISFEIILIDDASEVQYRKLNVQLSKSDNVSYFQLEKNIGRAKIRNLFLSYTNFNYLLFLDSDSQVNNTKCIENYLTQILKKNQVICGGRSYPGELPHKSHYLRWKFGINRECLPAKNRSKNPYRSFMTNNFVIHRNVLSKILFDERLTQYGHEDTLFGYRLKQNKIPIIQIDNPVQHLFTESNIEFIQKTELALKNLIEIRKFIDDKKFDNEIRMLRMYSLITYLRIGMILSAFYFLFKPAIKWLIVKNIGGLKLFDFYKLLFFTNLTNKGKN